MPWHRACGANGRMCKEWELYATAGISSSSNFFMIPALYVAWKQACASFKNSPFLFPLSLSPFGGQPLSLRIWWTNNGLACSRLG